MIPLFRFLADLEDFIFPPFCSICDGELKRAKIICQKCFDKTYFVYRKKCNLCGRPIRSGRICRRCKEITPSFDFVISCGSYVPPFSDIIKIYKYRNRPSLSGRLARKLYSCYSSRSDISEVDYLTWVPMRRAEKRERGYNQSKLLAEEFSKMSSLKSIDLLYKAANIPSQTTLPDERRPGNVKGAYKIREKTLKTFNGDPNKGIILIDDVLTTGSTLNECAKRLKEAGFKKVFGLVLAISP
jgi:competence protein ComFC